jgi:SEC-C motif-containing protein
MAVSETSDACPCGAMGVKKRREAFRTCCERFLGFDGVPVLDSGALQLMRSRYSAFVLGRADYLLATWHGSTRPESLDLEKNLNWLGLDVREYHQDLGACPPAAMVHFIARYRDASGRAVRLQERSRFVYEAGRWWYVDGEQI